MGIPFLRINLHCSYTIPCNIITDRPSANNTRYRIHPHQIICYFLIKQLYSLLSMTRLPYSIDSKYIQMKAPNTSQRCWPSHTSIRIEVQFLRARVYTRNRTYQVFSIVFPVYHSIHLMCIVYVER